jgi:hypothetical protein
MIRVLLLLAAQSWCVGAETQPGNLNRARIYSGKWTRPPTARYYAVPRKQESGDGVRRPTEQGVVSSSFTSAQSAACW